MRCARICSSSLLILLLTLFLPASSLSPPGAAQTSSKVIRVWTIGSPHTGALPPAVAPPALLRRAESLGYTIEVETLRASGFVDRFRQAVQEHNQPEVLTFDNYGVISGMATPNGWIEGLYSNRLVASSLVLVHETLAPLQSRGWVMLVRSAVNYEAARTLSMQPGECDDSPSASPALQLAQEKAVFAARAYLDCDRSTLAAISDESRLVQQCFMPQSDTRIESVKACRIAGNQKLALVSLASVFSAEIRETSALVPLHPGTELGQQSILAVLRNQSGTWKLLAITHDPLNTVMQRPLTTLNTLVKSLDQGERGEATADPAQLVTPDGVYPRPIKNERFGDLTWQPSGSNDVTGQVVEFAWGKDTNWGLTRLFFLPASENKLSTGLLMSGGVTVWRVWSVTKAGDVAFSEQRSFMH